MLPVSSRAAVAAAVKAFKRADQADGLAGYYLGDTQQTSAAMSGASAGAKAGSVILPGIGTAIGAVVGAVVGWLSTKKKPVRASAAQVEQCRATLAEYMEFAAQSPNHAIPMDWTRILELNWCFQAVYGAETALRDPRWFNQGFEAVLKPIALDIVRKIYSTPVGATVNLGAINAKDSKGKPMSFPGFEFTNPVFTNIKELSARYFEEVTVKVCQGNAGKGAGGCITQYNRAEWKRLAFDMMGWAARTALPNISEADLAAASDVAGQIGSSAKDVVSAVETIMQRSVQRNETALALTQTGAATQDVIKEIANAIAQTSPPAATLTPEQQTRTTPLATPPASVTPSVQADVTQSTASASQVQAAGVSSDLLAKAGPLLVLAVLGFALARPQR
jgi:hypothetical protein